MLNILSAAMKLRLSSCVNAALARSPKCTIAQSVPSEEQQRELAVENWKWRSIREACLQSVVFEVFALCLGFASSARIRKVA